MAPRNTDHGKGICRVCKGEKSLTANLRIRSHRINGVSCDGGSDLPYDPAQDGDQLAAGVTSAVPVDDPFGDDSFDPTDASTWTTEVDDRPTLFDVRNAQKVIDSSLDETAAVPQEILAEAERTLIQWENEGARSEERPDTSTVLPEMGQTDDPPAKPVHGGPNPHRAPLPTVATYDTPKTAVSDDVNAFMNGSAKPSRSTAADVNDFMSGDDPEEEKTPPWFPAKYDGNCESCGSDFGEGEDIRADGSGGWEARECCGSDEDAADRPAQVRPKVVYPKLPVVNGRYRAPHPETGEKSSWTRVTNFVKKASDHFALELWGNRSLAVGLFSRPDLLKQVDGKDVKADRTFLNRLVEEAKQAAGSKDRARLGTIMHKHTEEVDAGHKDLADVPDQFRDDVAVYLDAMKIKGLMMLPHLMERSTAVVDLEVIGTFDGIVRLPDGTYAVGDKKTGATLEFNQAEIAVQIAIYAHGVNSVGVATAVFPEEPAPADPTTMDYLREHKSPTWTWEKPRDEDGNVIKVREDIGIVIHIPYGTGDCFIYAIPLDVGWRGAQLCREVQKWQKVKNIVSSVPDAKPSGIVAELEKATAGAGTVLDSIKDRGFEPPTAANTGKAPVVVWMGKFADVTSKEEALELYAEVKAEGASEKVLKVLVEVGKGALKALATKPSPAADLEPKPAEQPWESLFATVKSQELAKGLYGKAKAAGLSSGRLVELAEIGRAALKKLEEPATFPDQAPELTWEDRFMLVTSKEEALELYRDAKDQVSPERLKALVQRGKTALAANATVKATIPEPEPATPPSWEDRFKAVTTKDQARELYEKARAEVATLGMTRLTALIALGKEALSFHEEPPF